MTVLPPNLKPLRILVVEDHQETVRTLKLLLTSLGYTVSTAQTVSDALRIAGEEHFDVLLADIGLPDGSGFDLLHTIRQRQNINGIALTGHGLDEDVQKSREVGFRHHLVKPVSLDRLQAAIQEVQGLHEPSTAA